LFLRRHGSVLLRPRQAVFSGWQRLMVIGPLLSMRVTALFTSETIDSICF
jgi:hypothetical protein